MGQEIAKASRNVLLGAVRPIFLLALLIAIMPFGVMLIQPTPKASGPIIVNTTSDSSPSHDGFCSLREAINNANSPGADTTEGDCLVGTGNDVIDFSVSGTITLKGGLPAIQNTVTIDGTGQTITVDGVSNFQALAVNPSATLNLNNLSVVHGNPGVNNGGVLNVTKSVFSDNKGSAIYNGSSSSLTVANSSFLGNVGFEGAIWGYATSMTIIASAFVDNSGSDSSLGGGAIGSPVSGGSLNVSNSTFSGNSTPGSGGAIAISGGAMAVSGSTFAGNSATYGGGIVELFGTVTVSNSTFLGNTATQLGGGIANFGTLTITDSTFTGNTAPEGSGGGIFNFLPTGVLTVTNSTFSGNSAANQGGGIGNEASLTLSNTTFLGNNGATPLPTPSATATPTATPTSTASPTPTGSATPTPTATPTPNRSGGGIANIGSAGGIVISKSILADSAGGNCGTGGSIDNLGDNISDDASCNFGSSMGANLATIGDSVNPLLAVNGLQFNGGLTETIGLQTASPAISAIPAAQCPATDQRGDPRPAPSQAGCDIGAFELQGTSTIYVANFGGNTVTEYSLGSNGDQKPIATIGGPDTGLSGPSGLALDPRGDLYVANLGADSITVYPPGASGDQTPIATISGPDTGLSDPIGLAVSPVGDLYVANFGESSISVYPPGANGDQTPKATISGMLTSLNQPLGITFDSRGNLYAVNGGAATVTEYPPNSNGDQKPIATIGGPDTGLEQEISVGVAVNLLGNISVANQTSTVTEYAPNSNGDQKPGATIIGTDTGLDGILYACARCPESLRDEPTRELRHGVPAEQQRRPETDRYHRRTGYRTCRSRRHRGRPQAATHRAGAHANPDGHRDPHADSHADPNADANANTIMLRNAASRADGVQSFSDVRQLKLVNIQFQCFTR